MTGYLLDTHIRRMIIWQAIGSGMTLISRDQAMEEYREHELELVW